MRTNDLVNTYASKAAQSTLMRNVYSWMTLALVITGFVSLYMAKSQTLLSMIMQNSMLLYSFLHVYIVYHLLRQHFYLSPTLSLTA